MTIKSKHHLNYIFTIKYYDGFEKQAIFRCLGSTGADKKKNSILKKNPKVLEVKYYFIKTNDLPLVLRG